MSDESVRLGLPYIQGGQAQKHVTHNEALARLDLLVQLVVQGFGAETPPASPAEGQVWALGAAPTGAWTGQAGRLAAWSNGGWLFVAPGVGWQAVLGGTPRYWTGSAWETGGAGDLTDLPGVGIGTGWDVANRLAVASAATLFTHEGAGHQLKLNKAAAGDTASVLFQTGYAGRAEFGTAGSDDFSVKVSPDGSTWQTALTVDRTTGAMALGQPLPTASGGTGAATPAEARANLGLVPTASATDATAGRLLRVGDSATLMSASPALRAGLGGSANAITLTSGAGFTGTPPTGLALRFRATAPNTGATTIALDGGSAVACRTITGAVLPEGYVRTDAETEAVFDGTHWVLGRAPESGTNADGSFDRQANGAMQVTKTLSGLGPISTASGSDFISAAITVGTLAAAFAAVPVRCGSSWGAAISGIAWLARASATTGGTLHLQRSTSSALTTYGVDLVFTGRWY